MRPGKSEKKRQCLAKEEEMEDRSVAKFHNRAFLCLTVIPLHLFTSKLTAK